MLLILTMACLNSMSNLCPKSPLMVPAYFFTTSRVAASSQSLWSDSKTPLPSRTFLKKLVSKSVWLSLSNGTGIVPSPLLGHRARSCDRNDWFIVGSAFPVAVKLYRRYRMNWQCVWPRVCAPETETSYRMLI